MCSKDHASVNRRGIFSFLASAGALSFLPRDARAAGHVEALAITCIDYRLVDDAVRFFDRLKLTNEYDQVSLAGAALAAVSPTFPSSNAAFWDHVAIAKQLHHVKQVIVMDHRDCGAYKVAFGKKFASARDAETAQHRQVMAELKAKLGERHPDLGSSFYLMSLDGKAEKVI
jgi:carbonic anhydrase